MNRTAHLSACITWSWQSANGRDHEADVIVDYTYDGDTIRTYTLGNADGLPEREEEALIDYIECEYAPQDYAEWLADCADHSAELAA